MARLSENLKRIALERLSQIDARLTSAREETLAILEAADKPMTIIEISDKSKDLAQSSLYRNLTLLEESNLVHKITTEHDFAFFELSEDLLGHHHHLRCINCAQVIDVELSTKDEKTLHTLAKSIAKKYGFTNIHHHLEFSGLCAKCS